MTIDDVLDLRKAPRYVTIEPLRGSFGASEVEVADLGACGLRIIHTSPLRIGTRARLAFAKGQLTTAVQARVVWSRVAHTPGGGPLVYNSGLAVDNADNTYLESLQALARAGVIRKETDSLERKRQRIAARELERQKQPKVMPLGTASADPER